MKSTRPALRSLARGCACGRTAKEGFTLIEMLVVVAVIAILAALIAVWIPHITVGAKYKATKARIDILDAMCSDYRLENGQYPPMTYAGSQNLHYYLGSARTVTMPGGSTTTRSPHHEFPRSWLAPGLATNVPSPPSFVYDAWDRVIVYSNAGATISIVSEGRLVGDPSDDVTNTQQDW